MTFDLLGDKKIEARLKIIAKAEAKAIAKAVKKVSSVTTPKRKL